MPPILSRHLNPLLGLALLYVITQKEFILSRLIVGDTNTQIFVAFIILFFLARALLFHGFSILSPTSLFRSSLPYIPWWLPSLRTFMLVLSGYFLFHETLGKDGLISIKYFANILFFFSLLALVAEKRFVRLENFYVTFCCILCVGVIIQSFLVGQLYGLDMVDFSPIEGMLEIRPEDTYKAPFYLGFYRQNEYARFGPISFFRAMSFTTEPKYFSLLLWIAVTIYLFRITNLLKQFAVLSILGLGLFLCHAYTSVLICTIGLFLFILLKFVRLNAWIISIALPLALTFLPQIAGEFLSDIGSEGSTLDLYTAGYSTDRVASFNSTFRGLESFMISDASLLGEGTTREQEALQTHLAVIRNYGIIGFVLNFSILMILTSQCLSAARKAKDARIALGLTFFLATVHVFFGVFGSEVITTSLMFFIVVAIKVMLEQEQLEKAPKQKTSIHNSSEFIGQFPLGRARPIRSASREYMT